MNDCRCSTRQGQDGLGLLDVVVGMALMAVAVLAAAQLVMDTNNMRQTIEIQRLVSDHLDSQLKQVEVTSFPTIQTAHDGRGFPVESPNGLRLEAPQGDPDGLPGLVSIEVPDPPGNPDQLVRVTVEVEWADRSGTHRQSRSALVSSVGGL